MFHKMSLFLLWARTSWVGSILWELPIYSKALKQKIGQKWVKFFQNSEQVKN